MISIDHTDTHTHIHKTHALKMLTNLNGLAIAVSHRINTNQDTTMDRHQLGNVLVLGAVVLNSQQR